MTLKAGGRKRLMWWCAASATEPPHYADASGKLLTREVEFVAPLP